MNLWPKERKQHFKLNAQGCINGEWLTHSKDWVSLALIFVSTAWWRCCYFYFEQKSFRHLSSKLEARVPQAWKPSSGNFLTVTNKWCNVWLIIVLFMFIRNGNKQCIYISSNFEKFFFKYDAGNEAICCDVSTCRIDCPNLFQ